MNGPTMFAVVVVAFFAAVVLLFAISAWRDVRVARWQSNDPRADRQARRAAAKQVRQHGGE